MPSEPNATGAPHGRIGKRSLRLGLTLVLTLVLSILAVPLAFADGGRDIQIQDKCDPATFNAFAGDTVCFKSAVLPLMSFLQSSICRMAAITHGASQEQTLASKPAKRFTSRTTAVKFIASQK